MVEFEPPRNGSGTREWSEYTENIGRGCPNNCRYCYAALNAKRFKLRERDDWSREELTKRANAKTYPKRDGVIMFPSAHDITPFNVEAFIRIATLMLEAGNHLLIVSKPRLECIEKVVDALMAYRESILFRFTIGTMDEETSAFWEPGAPAPKERIAALRLAFEAGYRTSISAEPLLGGLTTAIGVLDAVRPYVTDTVWIGKMNKISTRVERDEPRVAEEIWFIEANQNDEGILSLVGALGSDPLVRWKDSVKEVVERYK